jgi:hypothetical protein
LLPVTGVAWPGRSGPVIVVVIGPFDNLVGRLPVVSQESTLPNASRLASRFRRLTNLTLAALLAGCTGFLPGLPADYVVEAEPDKGVIVGSVGTNPLGKQWREWSRYEYRSTSDPKLHGHVTSAVNWSNPFYPQPECPDDGLPAECASLFAIVLAPGEYEFWAVAPAMDSRVANPGSGWDTLLEGYRFEVQAGQAVYLGNLLSRLCGGSSYSHYGIASIGVARIAEGDVADMYERDVPLLRKKFPQLGNTIIRNAAMTPKPWRWEYKQPVDQVLPAIRPSNCAPVREPGVESQ